MPPSSSHVLPLPDPEAAVESSPSDAAPSNASRWRKVLVFVLTAAVGALSAALVGSGSLGAMDLGALSLADAVLLAVGLPAAVLLIVAIHEGGHTVAGYLAGFQLQHVSVGPLKLQRTPSGWNASYSQHGFFEGMSHSVPGPALQEASQQTVRRGRAVRLVGGAAANVLSGLLALGVVALGLVATGPVGGEAMQSGILLFGVSSLGVGVANLIPLRTGSGLITDGARLFPLLRGTPEAGRDVALATVRAEAYGGTRPSDWNPRWVEQMLTPRDHGITDGSTRMLAYRHALDAGRPDDARTHLAEALHLLDRLPCAQHAGLMIEAAYFEAAHRGDAERARARLQRAGGGDGASPTGVPDCAAGRAEGATLLAEGKPAEARHRISEAKLALDDHPVPGTAVAERVWLKDLARRASNEV